MKVFAYEKLNCLVKFSLKVYFDCRFLERQERISQNFIRKNRRDIEKLQKSIEDISKRSISLQHFDFRTLNEKFGRLVTEWTVCGYTRATWYSKSKTIPRHFFARKLRKFSANPLVKFF